MEEKFVCDVQAKTKLGWKNVDVFRGFEDPAQAHKCMTQYCDHSDGKIYRVYQRRKENYE